MKTLLGFKMNTDSFCFTSSYGFEGKTITSNDVTIISTDMLEINEIRRQVTLFKQELKALGPLGNKKVYPKSQRDFYGVPLVQRELEEKYPIGCKMSKYTALMIVDGEVF